MTVHELQLMLDRAEPNSDVFCVVFDAEALIERTYEVDQVGLMYVDGEYELRILQGEEVM